VAELVVELADEEGAQGQCGGQPDHDADDGDQ
jgi:hypothetical protein